MVQHGLLNHADDPGAVATEHHKARNANRPVEHDARAPSSDARPGGERGVERSQFVVRGGHDVAVDMGAGARRA